MAKIFYGMRARIREGMQRLEKKLTHIMLAVKTTAGMFIAAKTAVNKKIDTLIGAYSFKLFYLILM
ncbi:MAG: hypothetical protein M0R40_05715 [Firmicutes bacterium]|nr:hypothetical protein [Bacillota bacterium]